VALALSLATTVEFAGLYALAAKRIPSLSNREMRASLARMVVACGVMAAAAGACLVALTYGASFDLQHGIEALAAVVICAAAGAVTYAAASLALGVGEMSVLLVRMRRMVNG
jgi:O-antigen/teichoic acid export membrane protein